MFHVSDPAYVRQQYATNANLDARITLHRLYSTATENFHDWLFAQIVLAADANVLEVGGGSGALWERVEAHVPGAWCVTVTDLSVGMVSTVRAKLSRGQFRYATADAAALCFSDSAFDGILANHMLYHVPDLPRALHEIRRALKPGGTLYAATNGADHMRELNDLVARIQGAPVASSTAYAQAFGLQNGADLLAPYFSRVERHDFPDALEVTDVEPLVAYVNSGASFNTLASNPTRLAEFRRRVQSEISTRGAFHITKSVGLFVSR